MTMTSISDETSGGAAESPPSPVDWNTALGFLQSWELVLILLGPLILVLGTTTVVSIWIRARLPCRFKKWSRERFRLGWTYLREQLREGMTVDLSKQTSVKELLAEEDDAPDCAAPTCNRTIGLSPGITEGEVREAYSDEKGDKVVLILRLAYLLVANGMCSVDVIEKVKHVASALDIKLSFISVGLNQIHAQFAMGTVVDVRCTLFDYKLSLQSDIDRLVILLAEGRGNAKKGLRVLGKLENRTDPYGWMIRFIAIWVICAIAPVTVYKGGYPSMVSGAIIAPVLIIEMVGLAELGLGFWETPLISFTVGLLGPVVWQLERHLFGVEQCSAMYTFGVIILWLPGSSLVFGVNEINRSSFIVGSARLAKGIVQAMLIALFYTFGWQYWGHNWTTDETRNGEKTNMYGTSGPIASLPPSKNCGSVDYFPWWFDSVILMIPLNLASLIVYHIRLRECIGTFIVGLIVYAFQGLLAQCSGNCALPYYVQVFLVAFIGGFSASANEFITGFSQICSMIVFILILAPGAGAVRSVLGAFHRLEGDYDAFDNSLWESVVFEGTAYASGFNLGFEVWKPMFRWQTRKRKHAGKAMENVDADDDWADNISDDAKDEGNNDTSPRGITDFPRPGNL